MDQTTPYDVSKEYWAAKPIDEVGEELTSRLRFTTAEFVRNPLLTVARRAYRYYYTMNDRGHSGFKLGTAGEQGELTTMAIPHFQALIRNTVNLITKNRPALQPVASNGDFRSQAQTKIASGVLDYYVRKELEEKWQEMATQALVMSASYLKASWDVDAGEEDPITGEKAGDLKFSILTPFDVNYDESATDDDHRWMITREYENKYDLAARYQPWADTILAIDADVDGRMFSPTLRQINGKSDLIPVFEFFHKRTSALPQGRHVIFLKTGDVVYDGPLPTRNIPVVSITAGKIFNTPWAFSPFWGMIGMQQAIDMTASMIMTNLASFGGATLVAKKDSALAPQQMGPGFQVVTVTKMEDKPEVLDMTPNSAGAYQALEFVKSQMQIVSGINDVARGAVPQGITSGAALAMVQSQAFLANSDFERQYEFLMEKTGQLVFEFLKSFALQTRTISVLSGKSNQYMMKAFSGQDISNIDRCEVQIVNPVFKSATGKLQLADTVMKIQNPKDRQTYIQIANTGRDDNMTEAPFRSMMNIRKENEDLSEGMSPIALLLDNHQEHIAEHYSLLQDPDVRMNPELVQSIMEHIDQHFQYWRQMTPAQLMIAGLNPLPPDAPVGPPPGPGPQGPGAPGPMPQGQNPGQDAGQLRGPSTPVTEAEDVNMPNLPTNPATGQQWNPETGGL